MDQEVLETLNREFIKRVLTKILEKIKEEITNEEATKLINEIDEYGASLLHYVTAINYYELIPILHEAGADLNIKTSNNLTPLIIAAAKGHEKSLKKLIRLGAVFWKDESEDEWEDEIANNERERGSNLGSNENSDNEDDDFFRYEYAMN